MKEIVLYHVIPHIPDRLRPLEEIAKNLWFCWNLEAIDLFRSVDLNLWEETNHNPVALLGRISEKRLQELLEDDGFLLEMDRIYQDFKRYTGDRKAYDFRLKTPINFTVAYFSAEYALTDCLPVYSGGLGVLAGDHLKSASDLCIPIVGVGLLYQKGYFRQYLNADGWQLETYPDNQFSGLPVQLERDGSGDPLTIVVPIGRRSVKIRVWRIQVGRIPLFMLDTNTIENAEEDRNITASLYGGDAMMRLKQEIVLGIGGVRALNRMGIEPSVIHMNEGHSAFTIIERIRLLMEKHQLSFQEAREAVYTSSVFTTHTPVPAGIDVFDPGLLASHLEEYVHSIGIPMETLLAMGNEEAHRGDGLFNMAVMSLRNSGRINGVSQLHQTVSRRMWKQIWPGLPEVDLPIHAVTNGIHVPSWISNDMASLMDRYLGRRWAEDPDPAKILKGVDRIPDLELWRTHERRRERLVAFARRRLQEQLLHRGAPRGEVRASSEVLNPQALTIGFARRFATYKRGDLILSDPSRLAQLLNHPQRPVQIIFAGKAHPNDHPGKEVIKKIVHLTQQPEFRHRMVFIEDYDLNVARYMVQGADVWLNNPRRPLEACGTSGMKAAANGALNLSVLDGWWAEGYQPGLGWAIGNGEEYEDLGYQDGVESQAIYNLLERTIIPFFYERGRDNLPREWTAMMKNSMGTLAARFNSHRMLQDYVHEFYLPLAFYWNQICADRFQGARELVAWAQRLKTDWPQLKILDKRSTSPKEIEAGKSLDVEATLYLGSLSPRDLSVEVYYGPVDSKANFVDRSTIPLLSFNQDGEKVTFKGQIPCREVGRFGFRIRILPSHPFLNNPYSLGLILWG